MQELFFDSTMESFNAGWRFLPPGTGETGTPDRIPDRAEPVTLPHAWNSEGWSYEPVPKDAPAGTGWYYQRLSSGDAVSALKFEGVAAECEVFLDGEPLVHNLGAYKPFEVELGGVSGLLAVKVTDKPDVKLLPEGCDPEFAASPRFVRWALPMGSSIQAGGIWRNVWAVRRGDVFLRTPELRAGSGSVAVLPEVVGPAAGFRLKCVLSRNGEQVAEAEAPADSRSLTLSVPDFREWLPLHPELYSLETSLLDSRGAAVQTVRQPAAFFDLCIRDSGFYLNGRPYFLRGQNGFPHCNVPHDREYIARYVAAVRKQGVEVSRFHTEPPPHAWLDECDRQGIMVIFEMALHGSFGCYPFGSAEFRRTALDEIKGVIREYRRHPSIAFWSLGNEMIVACERDRGLGKPLFDVLESWIAELRPLDPRPVIANSGSDAANLLPKSVGDVDDVHQYGGWYVENVRDLRHFGEFTRKDDMLFQPCISTESVAAYTNDAGEFFIKHSDIRQKKMVEMRLGRTTDFSARAQKYQAFLLKEYAEALWRLRRSDSSFSGYIPFGQYTWFSRPFDKGPDGIRPKMIWDTFHKVMGPVHVQLECWNRDLTRGGSLSGEIHLLHEDISLPDPAEFTLSLSCGGKLLEERTVTVAYHDRADFPATVGPFDATGGHALKLEVRCGGRTVACNDLEFRVYPRVESAVPGKTLAVYDPTHRLDAALEGVPAEKLSGIEAVLALPPDRTLLVVGPHALDRDTEANADRLRGWLSDGGRAVVLEQNPGAFSEDVFHSGVGFVKKNQPYWSRWATNLVKHADRADLLHPEHPVFAGLAEDDLRWWNGDTFLAHAYLNVLTVGSNDRILSRIGNGLADDELMPVAYDYVEPGYSTLLMERKIGKGALLLSSLLIGEKAAADPVAAKLLMNCISTYSGEEK